MGARIGSGQLSNFQVRMHAGEPHLRAKRAIRTVTLP